MCREGPEGPGPTELNGMLFVSTDIRSPVDVLMICPPQFHSYQSLPQLTALKETKFGDEEKYIDEFALTASAFTFIHELSHSPNVMGHERKSKTLLLANLPN